ncbi:MAG TPA: hemerythrin family protein [Holophaga sp.]|nr:hemerythrin family protein [Holophaga sp.]
MPTATAPNLGLALEPLVWKADWETGDERIDGQHRSLVAGVNRLAYAIETGRTHDELWRMLSFLTVYVHTHFRTEEAIMAETGYPDLARHEAEHLRASSTIDRLVNAYRDGTLGDLREVVLFLHFWINTHFLGTDLRLAKHLGTR